MEPSVHHVLKCKEWIVFVSNKNKNKLNIPFQSFP